MPSASAEFETMVTARNSAIPDRGTHRLLSRDSQLLEINTEELQASLICEEKPPDTHWLVGFGSRSE